MSTMMSELVTLYEDCINTVKHEPNRETTTYKINELDEEIAKILSEIDDVYKVGKHFEKIELRLFEIKHEIKQLCVEIHEILLRCFPLKKFSDFIEAYNRHHYMSEYHQGNKFCKCNNLNHYKLFRERYNDLVNLENHNTTETMLHPHHFYFMDHYKISCYFLMSVYLSEKEYHNLQFTPYQFNSDVYFREYIPKFHKHNELVHLYSKIEYLGIFKKDYMWRLDKAKVHRNFAIIYGDESMIYEEPDFDIVVVSNTGFEDSDDLLCRYSEI